ncbi:beta-phosphoglucomutase family hydrolase [Litoribacter alkaliphilus]|uniref:Beta-phosphoglucomutase n=1 Tax=Litoribacter ruber TaxID=702568 RepID=A0AAP2CGA1_9BACT|nr:beta-phosphoglucomutase family hydrolase [Litoribacter alkaliphilus]MBS9522989.1 beta-phosphoglucomutase family hydrolase [Litoribacter alkaliphilus]
MQNKIIAAIFDLDGVLTRTAAQHAKAWKQLFDAYNEQRKEEGEQPFEDFSIEIDYPKYIDGIPRYDGIRNFLQSRNIKLPEGYESDEPNELTIRGLGNRKNEFFLKVIEEEGVEVFEKNIDQIKKWKAEGVKTAVISSSKNCKKILEVTGIEELFETRIDGVVSKERNIKGKPSPDIFLAAAKELGVDPEESMIVEDAIAGVEAGSAGGFGLVVGIVNGASKEELLKNGADLAVQDLTDVKLN